MSEYKYGMRLRGFSPGCQPKEGRDITNEVKDFKKFYIIPKNEVAMEIHSANADDAMSCFAFAMDSDMNTYFRAVTEEEYNEMHFKKRAETERQEQIDFFVEELEKNYDIPEEDIEDVAERAFECYCKSGSYGYGWAEGLSEYDALEMAVDEYMNKEG